MLRDSIWNNNFYNKSPVPTWSFEMDFTQLFLNKENKEIYGNTLNEAVISCTWPERMVNTIPVYYAGIEGKLPGRANNSGDLEIKFNENNTFQVTKILEELFHADSYCDAYFEDRGGYSFNKDFIKTGRTIRLIILNPTSRYNINPSFERSIINAPIEIQFKNCWCSKIGSQEMSYDNDSDVITKTATFTYDYFKVLGNSTTQVNDECKGDET